MELDTKQRELCNEIEKDFGRCEELWNQQYACVEKGEPISQESKDLTGAAATKTSKDLADLKEYTYEEINSMIDSNIITFYWVENNSQEEKQHMIEYKNPAFSVVGIKSIDGAGEFRDDVNGRMENFKAALNKLKEIGHTQYTENIDGNNIKIIGVVVVGSPKELKVIQNDAMIKHAVLGTVVDKY